jgi:hypothetical protein
MLHLATRIGPPENIHGVALVLRQHASNVIFVNMPSTSILLSRQVHTEIHRKRDLEYFAFPQRRNAYCCQVHCFRHHQMLRRSRRVIRTVPH